MKDNGVPRNWLRAGGEYAMQTTGIPQILFESMAEKARELDEAVAPRHTTPYRRIGWNRTFEIDSLSGSLIQQDGPDVRRLVRDDAAIADTDIPDKTRFDLFVRESEGPGRSFHFRSPDDGTMVIEFLFEEMNSMVRLVQRPEGVGDTGDRCQLIEVVGLESRTISATDFRSLLEANQQYMDDKFIPLLDTLGIELVR
ncbi:MAG: hypothetical protein AAF456_15650 [Planctomycetota bacterium]